MKGLGSFLSFWSQVSNQYARLTANEEKRARSVRLGVTAMILAVISAALVVGSVWGLGTAMGLISDSPIVGIVVLLLCIGVAITFLTRGMINALLYAIYQLRLNKKAIGWVALVVWFISLAAAIGGSLLLLSI